MLHNLTIGHLDTSAIADRMAIVRKPLETDVVHRLLVELGDTDAQGRWTLGGGKVQLLGGYVVVPWLGGGTNRVTEEFALRLHRETGCVLADREHSRVIDPSQLQGLNRKDSVCVSKVSATSPP